MLLKFGSSWLIWSPLRDTGEMKCKPSRNTISKVPQSMLLLDFGINKIFNLSKKSVRKVILLNSTWYSFAVYIFCFMYPFSKQFSTDLALVMHITLFCNIQSKNNLQKCSMQFIVKTRLLNQCLILSFGISGEILVNLRDNYALEYGKKFQPII